MKIADYLELMHTIEKLKNEQRHSWTSSGRRESVAEHSWRLALMAYFMKDEFPGVDVTKVIFMCICHDLGEAFIGDIPAFEKTGADSNAEDAALAAWIESLNEPYRAELSALFREMHARVTPEAQLYKPLDKMEALIQHNEADISTWLPLEYELNFTYGMKEAAFSPYTKALRDRINEDTAAKIGAGKGEGQAE